MQYCDGCASDREQPQFEFLELPNPHTSKLWNDPDEQSSDEHDTGTTDFATPPNYSARTTGQRDALRVTDDTQKQEHMHAHRPKPEYGNAESAAVLLSVESAVQQAGIQVSN